MSTYEAKKYFQEEVLAVYKKTVFTELPYHMALYSSTGSGKSKAALDCARWYYDTIEKGNMIIGCHSVLARDEQWPEELTRWVGDHDLLKRNVRFCYESLTKIKGQHFAILILDEAHYVTLGSTPFFHNNTFGAVIILTATEPRDPMKRKILYDLVGKNRIELAVDAAVDRGITNDYRINIFWIELDDTFEYVSLPWEKGNPHLYTEKKAYLQYCIHIDQAKGFTSKNKGKLLLMRYAALMRFMANTRTKMQITKLMMRRLQEKNRRFVVFANTKEQCPLLGPYYMHSGTDDHWFTAFKNKEVNYLISIDQIREGANVEGLDRAIIMQANSDPLPVIQRNGRLLRLDVHEQAGLMMPVFRGTYDDIWVTKALQKFARHKIIKHELPKELYWYE